MHALRCQEYLTFPATVKSPIGNTAPETPALRPTLVIEPAYFLRSYMLVDSLNYRPDAPLSWVLPTSFLPLGTLA